MKEPRASISQLQFTASIIVASFAILFMLVLGSIK